MNFPCMLLQSPVSDSIYATDELCRVSQPLNAEVLTIRSYCPTINLCELVSCRQVPSPDSCALLQSALRSTSSLTLSSCCEIDKSCSTALSMDRRMKGTTSLLAQRPTAFNWHSSSRCNRTCTSSRNEEAQPRNYHKRLCRTTVCH